MSGANGAKQGNYRITSDKGIAIANSLALGGGTYRASDGSVWTKNLDGTIQVREVSGLVTNQADVAPQTSKPEPYRHSPTVIKHQQCTDYLRHMDGKQLGENQRLLRARE